MAMPHQGMALYFFHIFLEILFQAYNAIRPMVSGYFKQQYEETYYYEPLCARPETRVLLAAPLLLLFPFAGMGDCLPVVELPFFLSLFLLVLNSDIQFNFKLVKLQKPYKMESLSTKCSI